MSSLTYQVESSGEETARQREDTFKVSTMNTNERRAWTRPKVRGQRSHHIYVLYLLISKAIG